MGDVAPACALHVPALARWMSGVSFIPPVILPLGRGGGAEGAAPLARAPRIHPVLLAAAAMTAFGATAGPHGLFFL